jgi:hypothetical protein
MDDNFSARRELLSIRLGRDIHRWVAERREAGASWRVIADEATAVSGVPVSHESMRAWFAEDAA